MRFLAPYIFGITFAYLLATYVGEKVIDAMSMPIPMFH